MRCSRGIPSSRSSTNSRTPTRRARAIRQALAGRAGAAGRRHRRDHDGQHPAHRVAQRRRRADHRRRAARDGSGCRGPRRRPDRGRRPRPAVAARPALGRSRSTRPSGSTRRCRTTSASATSPRCANSPCCGWPTRSTARSSDYRAEHGIDGTWQARERVVVALTGGPEGETLIRRGARIAARSAGGELLAVHVSRQDGLRAATPGALRRRSARWSSRSAARYHQVVGDDVPRALVEFARAVNATQLVIGVSRRGRLAAAFTGPGIGATVIRESGDIDVHIVTHAAAGGRFALPRITGGALSVQAPRARLRARARRRTAAVLAAGQHRTAESITATCSRTSCSSWSSRCRRHLAGAVRRRAVGPHARLPLRRSRCSRSTIADPLHALALVLYVVIAVLVSYIVDQAARRTRAAQRRRSRGGAARDGRRQRAARRERRARARQPHPRGVRA